MTEKELLDCGFKKFEPDAIDRYDMLYQHKIKVIMDGSEIFVNVRFRKHSKYGENISDGWDATCQFRSNLIPGAPDVKLVLSVSDYMTPQNIISFFINAWYSIGCPQISETDLSADQLPKPPEASVDADTEAGASATKSPVPE